VRAVLTRAILSSATFQTQQSFPDVWKILNLFMRKFGTSIARLNALTSFPGSVAAFPSRYLHEKRCRHFGDFSMHGRVCEWMSIFGTVVPHSMAPQILTSVHVPMALSNLRCTGRHRLWQSQQVLALLTTMRLF